MSRPRTRRPRLALLVHCLRVALVMALLLAIPSPTKPVSDGTTAPSLDRVQQMLPAARSVDGQQDAAGMWSVRDESGERIATLARTLPIAKDVVGYRGPTESIIVFDPELNIASVRLLDSGDTAEHVDAVLADESFFEQFKGWPWGGPDRQTRIDAVSGATLTSLALVEGVLRRIGGDRPSLVFPDPITAEELQVWFPGARYVEDRGTVSIVKGSEGEFLGRVLRTGPLIDDISGYQGPTEMLMRLSGDTAEKIRLRRSYDNEPYVDYVRVESGFWAIFEGKLLSELVAFDPAAAGVEGVSGATMTSLAVADTIVAAARQAEVSIKAETVVHTGSGPLAGMRWTFADFATITILLLAAVASRIRWYHHRSFRKTWLLTMVIVIGLWAGNLVSLALIAGWSAEGIAWRLAPGLFAIAIVAIVAPPISKGNPYCNHLCPHGAIQQLIKPSAHSRRHRHPSRRLTKLLRCIPGITLVAAYLALIIVPSIDLSAWEPFHAYLFRMAGWSSIALAMASLLLAAFIPMGYCRFGCPTGSLLDYLRRTATSDRFRASDLIALILLATAWIMR